MIEQLVINGCSYNEVWASNQGPAELAKVLGLDSAKSIALGGSCNNRILRTTLKHSYQTSKRSFYAVGLTFLNRWELPVAENREFEGRWINPQSQKQSGNQLISNWTDADTEAFKNLQFKAAIFSEPETLEDLMYRCLAVASDLQLRGHKIVFWNNCEEGVSWVVEEDPDRFQLLKNNPIFVDGLVWAAIPWQHSQGAIPSQYRPGVIPPPRHLQHILPEDYKHLNGYLTQWIKDNKILQ